MTRACGSGDIPIGPTSSTEKPLSVI